MVVILHILAGCETDTYTWSQQGSPEICFCTGGNRVFSQGVCDLKTCPDHRVCPVPCLRENGVRQTQSGVWELKWGEGLQGKVIVLYRRGITFQWYEDEVIKSDDQNGDSVICLTEQHASCITCANQHVLLQYLCQKSWTSWCDAMLQKICYDLPLLPGETIVLHIALCCSDLMTSESSIIQQRLEAFWQNILERFYAHRFSICTLTPWFHQAVF